MHVRICGKMPPVGIEPETLTPVAQTLTQHAKWTGKRRQVYALETERGPELDTEKTTHAPHFRAIGTERTAARPGGSLKRENLVSDASKTKGAGGGGSLIFCLYLARPTGADGSSEN